MERIGEEYFVGNRFKLKKKLGSGSFGDVYSSEDTVTGEEVAVKLSFPTHSDALQCEYTVYQKMLGAPGVPRLHCLFSTVLMLAGQMIDRVEYLHSLNYIHRDLKPDNFAMGIGRRSSQVYLLDFGLADKYFDPVFRRHVFPAKVANLYSTPRYGSINVMNYFKASRRDDLESLGYCFMYFLMGRLPWQGIKADTKREKYEIIAEMKDRLVPHMLEAYPPQFGAYMSYVRSLSFDQQPDYEYLRNLFKYLLAELNHDHDFWFDWDERRTGQTLSKISPM